MLKHALVVSILFVGLAAEARAVTIAWSTVGNPGNAGELSGEGVPGGIGPTKIVGAVNYTYRIGTYDVTANQYVEFLNAKDADGQNPLGLYNSQMSVTPNPIAFSANNPSGSKYSAVSGRENHPVNGVTWYNTIRFANWLNNGQGDSDTESGSYTLLGGTPTPSNATSITRSPNANVVLPNEDEWYKAAYYNSESNSYFAYPTSSNTPPIGAVPTGLPNHANFALGGQFQITDVGAYTGTTSPYGAFDMAGNVWNWTETSAGGAQSVRFFYARGGSHLSTADDSRSSYRTSGNAQLFNGSVGFRVALVPEPSSFVLAALGLIGLVVWKRRKR
jgi:sulfatase modifying factor 1